MMTVVLLLGIPQFQKDNFMSFYKEIFSNSIFEIHDKRVTDLQLDIEASLRHLPKATPLRHT